MHNMYFLISLIVFFIALVYAINEYFPDFFELIATIFEIGMRGDSHPPKFDDDEIFADGPSRGEWDESSSYYSSMHDLDSSSSISDD